jgi:hypothetical protein
MMQAANQIFRENEYTQVLQQMQGQDKLASSHSSSIPSWYEDSMEPNTVPGNNKGLVLMLDAHSDMLTMGSFESDFRDFSAFIGSSGSFPLMSQEGIEIIPGYINIITLKSTLIDADDSMKSLSPDKRNCYFPDENTTLTIHNEYTYLNCKLECMMSYAQQQMQNKSNSNLCMPWFLPTFQHPSRICNPWESSDFFYILDNEIPDDWCTKCLPDCGKTTYEPAINAIPFESCDFSNLGVSQFCSFNQKRPLPMTEKFATQVINEYDQVNTLINVPHYVTKLESSIRTTGKPQNQEDLFANIPLTYDAFEKV